MSTSGSCTRGTSAPLEETLARVDLAVGRGRTHYAGISNYIGWQTPQAWTWQAAVPGESRS